jgi:hypothetical protein
VQVAFLINSSPKKELPEIIEGLRRRRRLSATVHQLNSMLGQPGNYEIAVLALKRLGLEHAG